MTCFRKEIFYGSVLFDTGFSMYYAVTASSSPEPELPTRTVLNAAKILWTPEIAITFRAIFHSFEVNSALKICELGLMTNSS